MEGCVCRGRWNTKTHVCTILLLMYTVTPTLTLSKPSEDKTCPDGDYLTEGGFCCNKCSPGFKLVEKCRGEGLRSNCISCPAGQYTDQLNYSPNCRSCRRCKTSKHEIEVSPCEKNQNTICRCEDGYYKSDIDSGTYECRKCTPCGPDEKEKQKCTPTNNTVCECKENYYRVNSKCELCKNCTAECKHHCPSTPTGRTTATGVQKEDVINMIAGGIAVFVVALVLVIIITYMATKWSTKKKLLKSSSQPRDDSLGSCEQVLIQNDEPSKNISVKAIPPSPVSEQEQLSSLPDCVPFEIRIPDLIYTLLDLVPVLQVKQLVRSLGVKDIEIEQAELDHRSCREAHYQMLRVWAQRGSRAGGILHRHLLLELLDELRKMHLGAAAEELETKYSIQ